jgi:hypothetical protein
MLGVVGLAVAVFILATVFLEFPAAGLKAAEVLGSQFRGLAFFTLGCTGASVTVWEG